MWHVAMTKGHQMFQPIEQYRPSALWAEHTHKARPGGWQAGQRRATCEHSRDHQNVRSWCHQQLLNQETGWRFAACRCGLVFLAFSVVAALVSTPSSASAATSGRVCRGSVKCHGQSPDLRFDVQSGVPSFVAYHVFTILDQDQIQGRRTKSDRLSWSPRAPLPKI
jgi:hypothetical protein